jgi:hypothetical protein
MLREKISLLIKEQGLRVVEHRRQVYPSPFDGYVFETFVLSGLVKNKSLLTSDLQQIEGVERAQIIRVKGLPYIEDYDKVSVVGEIIHKNFG